MKRLAIAGLMLLAALTLSRAETNSPVLDQPLTQSDVSNPTDSATVEATSAFGEFASRSSLLTPKPKSGARRTFAAGVKGFLQKLNPFAPVASEAVGGAQPGKLGRPPQRPWGSIDQWTSAKSAFPDEVTHEPDLRVFSFECPASK